MSEHCPYCDLVTIDDLEGDTNVFHDLSLAISAGRSDEALHLLDNLAGRFGENYIAATEVGKFAKVPTFKG